MAKGAKCPNCAKLNFHRRNGVYLCSSCEAVGWYNTPESAGAGKGRKCNYCGAQTVRCVHTDKGRGFAVNHCSACNCTFIV